MYSIYFVKFSARKYLLHGSSLAARSGKVLARFATFKSVLQGPLNLHPVPCCRQLRSPTYATQTPCIQVHTQSVRPSSWLTFAFTSSFLLFYLQPLAIGLICLFFGDPDSSNPEKLKLYDDNNRWYLEYVGPNGAKAVPIGPLPMLLDELTRETYTVINQVRYGVTPVRRATDTHPDEEEQSRRKEDWFEKWTKGRTADDQLSIKAAKHDHLLAWIYLWNRNREILAAPTRIKLGTSHWIHRAAIENSVFIISAFTFLGHDAEQLHLLNLPNPEGKRPIQLASAAGHLSIVAILLMCGSNPDKPDDNGRTAFHYAAETGNVEIVKYLLTRRATANAIDKTGFTPLHLAISRAHVDTVLAMLTSSQSKQVWTFDQPPQTSTLLHEAVNSRSVDIVRWIVERMIRYPRDDKAVDANNMTPLALAERYFKEEGATEKNVTIINLITALSNMEMQRKMFPNLTAQDPSTGKPMDTGEESYPPQFLSGVEYAGPLSDAFVSSSGPGGIEGAGTSNTASTSAPDAPALLMTPPQYPPYITCNLDILRQLRWLISTTSTAKLLPNDEALRSYIIDVRAGRNNAWEYLLEQAKRGVVLTPALASLLSQKPYCGHWNSMAGTGCPDANARHTGLFHFIAKLICCLS